MANSPDSSQEEILAREFERWQKEYYDDVDSHFAMQNKAMGEIAFISWEQRFLSFISEVTPSLLEIYRTTVQIKLFRMQILSGASIHQSWKQSKGEAIEALLTQAIKEARAGRLNATATAIRRVTSKANNTHAKERIFIGHGRSRVWKDIKDFLREDLNLDWIEFNRESIAGKSTTERLQTMLQEATFAFLVLTAEDEHADGTFHSRENVIHEAGLFQGKLGFEKAIILLEDGCAPFSNISGLTYIPFPKGEVLAKTEDIRKVLKREGILQ